MMDLDTHKFIKVKLKHQNQNNQKNHYNQQLKFKIKSINYQNRNTKIIIF